MSCFVTGAIANDTKVIGEAYKEFGDVVFAPVKVSNYADQDNDMTFLAELAKVFGASMSAGWLLIVTHTVDDFHKKMVNSKSIIANPSPSILSNADIDSILAKVDEAGVRGSNRIQIILENRSSYSEVVPKTLSSENSEEFIRERNSGYKKQILVKELSKEELENTLQKLTNQNIKAYSVKVGTAKTSALKVGTSTVAVYLVLDMVHSLATGNM